MCSPFSVPPQNEVTVKDSQEAVHQLQLLEVVVPTLHPKLVEEVGYSPDVRTVTENS